VSSRSWGVGEFLDLPPFAKWARAGQSFVQVLPILEIPDHETSPYSALTAMALDPIFIALPEVEDFSALGGISALTPEDREALTSVQSATRVQHRAVRGLKRRWLRRAYERFVQDEAGPQAPRFQRFNAFAEREAWWLDDYALFRALRGVNEQRAWWQWAERLAGREAEALARAREELSVEIGYRKYLQWLAEEQWARARAEAAPVQVFGDVPFMISADSPDVWMDQEEFRFDATVGVPPDAFSETGQDWGLPPWRWDVMSQNDFAWMRRRARRTAALFDGFRLDHLVGLYRTFIRPIDSATRPFFAPADEQQQRELGDQLVRLYQDCGSAVIAEDLGTVPDFVRASLRDLGVPGFKVFRWERYWQQRNQPFVDPADYDEISVATTGTHDTEALATWWETMPADDRLRIVRLPSVKRWLDASGAGETPPAAFTPEIRDALVRALLGSGSRFTIFPFQDFFGWSDRINTPATVDDENWSWRVPWCVDELERLDEPRERALVLAAWTVASGR
jgi:4-alpha-glucanotransferase